jgi:8-oxo-dGTP pyrophosphatase MutT (NUDIX family)
MVSSPPTGLSTETPAPASSGDGLRPPPFSAEGFVALAAGRLLADPPPPGVAIGDHSLNPGFVLPQGFVARDAAVLIPVVARGPEATLLLTRRTSHLAAHAGQVAFPGGKIDPTDPTPVACAIREAEEEIGLAPGLVEPVGFLDSYLTGTGYRIVPVVARVSPDFRLTPNPDEVESVFEVPLGFLMTLANHRQTSREFNGVSRRFYEMQFEGHYIWGATAGIIRALYERVYC